MQLTERRIIAATPVAVYQALNDPAILKACIPGCEVLNQVSEHTFQARLKLTIGPISAEFNGQVEISDLKPPERYTISGQAQATAGFAKGSAQVQLAEHAEGTQLDYQVNAQVGGKLAQLGARLIDATAKKLAGEFFTRLGQQLSPPEPAHTPPAPPKKQRSWRAWFIGGLLALAGIVAVVM